MRALVCTLCITLAVFLNSIGLSLQFDCLPNGNPIPRNPRRRTPKLSDKHIPETSLSAVERALRVSSTLAPAIYHPPAEFIAPPAEPTPRYRSRSPPRAHHAPNRFIAPPGRLPSTDGYGCGLEELRYTRLISLTHPPLIFELRRYTFPANKPLEIRIGVNQYCPLPTDEQIVLSTLGGDVFAILETHNSLAGMYTYDHSSHAKRRGKINMERGTVTKLSQKEAEAAPVGPKRMINQLFRVERVYNV